MHLHPLETRHGSWRHKPRCLGEPTSYSRGGETLRPGRNCFGVDTCALRAVACGPLPLEAKMARGSRLFKEASVFPIAC